VCRFQLDDEGLMWQNIRVVDEQRMQSEDLESCGTILVEREVEVSLLYGS